MTQFDFIDIGTSDFEYSELDINCKDCKGLYVEPIKKYLDRLPSGSNIIKLSAAITDKDGHDYVYYIDPEIIKKKNLPDWIRGCNTVSKIHPTSENACKALGLDIDEITSKELIRCMTLKTLFEEYNITHVEKIKIDTEGSDCTIVQQAVELVKNNNIVINQITFETNELTSKQEIFSTFDLLSQSGWELVETGYNSTFRLKEKT